MTITPPIRRHPVLQPLSREHMSGLVQARSLAAAANEPPIERRAALARFASVWDEEIVEHFLDEERMLAPLLSTESMSRLLAEHRQLRLLAERAIAQAMSADPDADLMRVLGVALHDHIRWEEREAFNEAERAATDGDLQRLAADAAAIERDRPGSRPRLRL
ncbi:MAG: hemerythrin domain-containing protein [Phycisphaeraceae bacterium]|nr:hemerythrin domain-containing protein [Phycisphaeraceae bacterium]